MVKDVRYWQQRIVKPADSAINTGLRAMRASVLTGHFGQPRPTLSDTCQAVLNPKLEANLVVLQVHDNWKMRGLRPFVELWKVILDRIKQDEPTLYAVLGTEGCLCARLVRGSHSTPSNHSWGTAHDFKIGGVTDTMGDGYCQRGLLRIYEISKQVCKELGIPGLFWGAEFGREDSMHFETSLELLSYWLTNKVLAL